MVEIESDTWSALVDPQAGQLLALRQCGIDVLRPAPQLRQRTGTQTGHAAAAIDVAAFVMAPFAGRIANGAFVWRGANIRLARGPHEPHAIHGHAWQRPWNTVSASPNSITLAQSWSGAGDQSHWPWAYHLEQQLSLQPAGLSVRLALTNCGSSDMPAGLGWHPYFPRNDAQLTLPATHLWRVDSEVLPVHREPLSNATLLRSGEPVTGTRYDNPLQLDDGWTELYWPDLAQRLRLRWSHAGAARFAVVFNHPDENCFCVEPVTHIPNMVNLTEPVDCSGLVALSPGALLTLDCVIARADHERFEPHSTQQAHP